jgi:methylornithine synthase
LARQTGLLVEDGILLGAGETVQDRADSLLNMHRNDLQQVRVMSFVPQAQTPLGGMPAPRRMLEYLFIAVMRLVMPQRLIPASLDVDGIGGLQARLEAGANVVTSIIPPHRNLAGVSQSTLDIDQGLRTVPEVSKVLTAMDLRPAERDAYRAWMKSHQEATRAA